MKSLRGIRLRYFALVLSLIVIGIGVWQTFFTGQGYIKTTATIVSIEESEVSPSDDANYDVTVTYTVDGVEYSGLLGTYSDSYKVGKSVPIKYDPADPSRFQDDSNLMIIFMLIGVGILAVVIVTWVLEKKRLAEVRAAGTTCAPSKPSSLHTSGSERQLYFLTDLGTPKFGHRIEDENGRVLYEAKMTKFNMLTPFGFDFIDYEYGKTTPHLIGHTESSEWDSIFVDDHSTFTFDGEYIWKYLKRNGISVDSSLSRANLLKTEFVIYRNGMVIATAEASGKDPRVQDKCGFPAFGHYRILTTETNLDLLFLTLVAFTRTGATTDEGGVRKSVFKVGREKEA